jgi:CDP-diglyceride synthetase
MGSFFPGWMLCIALGVVGALVLRQIFIRTNIEADLGPRPLVYFCLWGLITLTLYLLFFRS